MTTLMRQTLYEETERNPSTIKRYAEFEYDIPVEDRQRYWDLKDRFLQYKFDHFIDEIKREFNYQFTLEIKYIICLVEEEYGDIEEIGFYFVNNVTIPNNQEVTYEITHYGDQREVSGASNSLDVSVENYNHSRYYVVAKVEVKIYRNYTLDMYEIYNELNEDLGYEDENEELQNSTLSTVETAFISDNCSVCLENLPNILLLPCRHFSLCVCCEEAGNIRICPVCRKTIQRKIKI